MKEQEKLIADLRSKFNGRKEECIALSAKITETLDVINMASKVEDVDTPIEHNNMPRVSVSAFAHNALLWYPKQAVESILSEFTPFYDSMREYHKPKTPLRYLLCKLPKPAFDFVAHVLPKNYTLVLRRYRTLVKIDNNLHTIRLMLDNKIEGKTLDPTVLSSVVSFAEIIAPDRASKNIEWIRNLYIEMRKINHNQIVGFSKITKPKKKK